MMNEHQILFSTAMVQANKEYIKTMTRRMTGLDKVNISPNDWEYIATYHVITKGCFEVCFEHKKTKEKIYCHAQYGLPGDLLWVRETFFDARPFKSAPLFQNGNDFYYKADGSFIGDHKWKPSIHMPKAAARIWLEVEEIRVERLQNISWNDAIAEGIHVKYWGEDNAQPYAYRKSKPEAISTDYRRSPIEAFQDLWEGINGEESWKSSPWVWVVKFKVLSTTGRPNYG